MDPVQAAHNVFRLLKANNVDIPVYIGSSNPIIIPKSFHRDFWYGLDGFSDVPNIYPPSDSVNVTEQKIGAVTVRVYMAMFRI